MKNIRKLSSTLFDAAGVVYLVLGIPALIVLIVVGTLIAIAVINVRKAKKQQQELAAAKRLSSEQGAGKGKDE